MTIWEDTKVTIWEDSEDNCLFQHLAKPGDIAYVTQYRDIIVIMNI